MTDHPGLRSPDELKSAIAERADSVDEGLARLLATRGDVINVSCLTRETHGLAGAAAALNMQPMASLAWSIAGTLESLADGNPPAPEIRNSLLALQASLADTGRAAQNAPIVLPAPALWMVLRDTRHAPAIAAAADTLARPLHQIDDPETLLDRLGKIEAGLLLIDHVPDGIARLKAGGWRVITIGGNDGHEAHVAAIRAGIDRHIASPFSASQLADTIARVADECRYSVLIVDEDVLSREARAAALRHAGFEVETLADPQRILHALHAATPDVLLVDTAMSSMTPDKLFAIVHSAEQRWSESLMLMGNSAGDKLPALSGDTALTQLIPELLRRAVQSQQRSALAKAWQFEHERGLIMRDGVTAVAFADATTPNFPLTYVNSGFVTLTGYSSAEVLGRNCRFLQGNDTQQPALVEIRKALSEGRPVSAVLSNYRKDGTLFWNDLTLSPIFNDVGKLTHYVGVQRDVTQRVKDEMALYKTVENLRTIQERLQLGQTNAHVGTMDWEISSGKMYWSDSVPPLFGYRSGEVHTDIDHFIAALHPDDCEAVLTALDACVKHKLHYDIEYRVVWPDGSIRWQSGSGAAIHDDRGNAIRLIAILQDSDVRKRTEISLVQAREEADRANRAKSEFLSHMSHELRTPMNAVLGFAQIMQYDDTLPESHVENVNEIIHAGNHLIELINEVLDLAKIESGSVGLSIEPVTLSSILNECLSLVQPMATQRGVTIRQMPVPACAVRADRMRLKQALLNLVSNGVKYNCEDGTLTVSVTDIRGGDWVQIRVSDTGRGLSPSDIERIFEPFERLAETAHIAEGTGIGLTITRRMVDMMGGSVNVESTPGSGSTFWIELPKEELPADWGPEHLPETDSSQGAEPGGGGGEHTILYVEDNPSNIRLMAQIMARRKHVSLRTAHTADMGIELALSRPPDLILLDINLPGLDGYEILRVLKCTEPLKHVPVIALSANALPGDIHRGRRAGFADYVTKPLDIPGFLNLLDRYLGKDSKASVTPDE